MATKAKPVKYKPMKHQAQTIALGRKQECMFDMSDPGTGKTLGQIYIFKERRGPKDKLLVLGPKSLLEPAWGGDLAKFAPDLRFSIANAENREAAFAADADVYITNVDAAVWLSKKAKGFYKNFTMLVVDEATAFKHSTSARSRALGKIKKFFRYRSALTGTPNPNRITDIWNIVNFLDDGMRLGNSFVAFRQSVCTPKQVGPRSNMVEWQDKPGAEDAVFSVLSDIVIRHERDKCLDLPENNQYTMAYKLSTKQMKAYKEMAVAQIALLDKKKVVTAINAAAVATKLLQIASGAVYESENNYHLIDTGRYELVLDLIEERQHSICFYLWKHQRDLLIEQAKKRGIKYCVYDGKASLKARNEMVRDFQAGFYQALFGHPASMAHGLTLTRATAAIWPSPTHNLEWYVQGNARHDRNGQKNKTETIVVVAPNTIEEKTYDRLMGKGERMSNLLGLFT